MSKVYVPLKGMNLFSTLRSGELAPDLRIALYVVKVVGSSTEVVAKDHVVKLWGPG